MSHASHGSHELGHILPKKTYVVVLLALLALTVITVVTAKVPMFREMLGQGNFNIVFAMTIATLKALLVALFFMHLKYEAPITWLYAIFPIILLAILIGGVFLDNPYRSDPMTGKSWKEVMQEKAAADAAKSEATQQSAH